ncbi:MAG TPA: dienelactone hydrolase family protein [Gemmataceae bacterium]|nr:dienelactone hydrolase family protein [Gemmataceae bacterium]
MRTARPGLALLTVLLLTAAGRGQEDPKPIKNGDPLPDTKPLTMEGDIAEQLVAGVDKFLLREIHEVEERRAKFWKRDYSSVEAYNKSIEPNRKRLAHILGLRDPRVPFDAPELVATTTQPALVGKGDGYDIFAVRWPAFGDVHGEGLLLVPTGEKKKVADVVAIPDADQTPEQIVGLVDGVPKESQFARRLAESGCRVIVPTLIDRKLEKRNGRANLTSREFLYRSAFEVGRHLIGYELQKVLAAVDWFAKGGGKDAKIGVMGYGEGGMLALYAGALDTRIKTICVSGYFGDHYTMWEEPIDRNVFGVWEQFGNGELAAMIFPRHLITEESDGPELKLPSEGGAPATLGHPFGGGREGARYVQMTRHSKFPTDPTTLHTFQLGKDTKEYGTSAPLSALIHNLERAGKLTNLGNPPQHLRKDFDPQPRQLRQQHEIDRHSQQVLAESPYVRREFLLKLADMSQASGNKVVPVAEYEKTAKEYRKIFAEDVIGKFDYDLSPMNPRSRKAYEAEKWIGYEVVLDVFPDVFAYGILLLPKDLKKDEKRPVVVCQHGLEGRPQDTIGKPGYPYYKAFAAELANRGFITFAPQNLYIGKDKFRTLQRKANPLGKTLFSVIVPQHQQIVNWLKTLPNVDGDRIGFYGLSYGGKSAMRIPALVTDYALSICSADFNEWVNKNASTRAPYSYVWTGEYEIFEFDLGSTFNYAEMAALIAPRPFMVERGHFDGVGTDEMVGYEFGKVRFLYEARLKLPGRCEIEWFDGPHTINSKGTFAFLHKHLKWPAPK